MADRKRWTADERAWARECLHAGDTIEEIAEWANRTVDDVVSQIGSGKRITPREREILSLYMAGSPLLAIADELGYGGETPHKVVAQALLNVRRKGIAVPYRQDPRARRGGVHG